MHVVDKIGCGNKKCKDRNKPGLHLLSLRCIYRNMIAQYNCMGIIFMLWTAEHSEEHNKTKHEQCIHVKLPTLKYLFDYSV